MLFQSADMTTINVQVTRAHSELMFPERTGRMRGENILYPSYKFYVIIGLHLKLKKIIIKALRSLKCENKVDLYK